MTNKEWIQENQKKLLKDYKLHQYIVVKDCNVICVIETMSEAIDYFSKNKDDDYIIQRISDLEPLFNILDNGVW
ncbi:hypothetical protein [Spiroplasma endosymbiont of Aspidapion aeneum]|uniref:hypothetical protein n=1 Tax=Spiroplasma endosymbiont of Aspidapion aeneum TaxID=3066276 RepID=UPI00313BF594